MGWDGGQLELTKVGSNGFGECWRRRSPATNGAKRRGVKGQGKIEEWEAATVAC